MFEQQPEVIQQKVKSLATQSLSQSDPSGWFDILYTQANGDYSQVPWAKLTLHPYLQNWLDTHQVQGNGRSALVIGCGLGDDAEALQERGFQVTAFDISPTAISWCRQRFPDSLVTYVAADLFALDPSWHRTFDFVFESRNIQALPLSVRSNVIAAIASVVAREGTLLVITRYRNTEAEPEGPPWPLSNQELAQFQELGFREIRRDTFFEGDSNTVKQLRLEYRF